DVPGHGRTVSLGSASRSGRSRPDCAGPNAGFRCIRDEGKRREKQPGMQLTTRLSAYVAMTKPLQTGLLLATGLAGYLSARPSAPGWGALVGVAGSLWLAISGSTLINMFCDRDIDACMGRTARRPIPTGRVSPREALWVGVVSVGAGLGWALAMSVPYGLVVLAGFFFDVVVYTLWLKRRTAWSIVWGGIAGGMPVLAGRTLRAGGLDAIGVLLAAAVVLWIPTHMVTFSIRHAEEYRRAGVPVLPNTLGECPARSVVAASSVAAVVTIAVAAYLVGLSAAALLVMWVLCGALVAAAAAGALRPSPALDFGLYKFASLYMLGTMALIAVGA
ncbi:MAG: UbiA family prenyltransferase, partial [Bacillota bacterium]